jgi:hypothetical protein
MEDKYKYYWQHDTTKEIVYKIFSVDQLEHGEFEKPDYTIRWDLLARCKFIGLKDKKGIEIYEGDVTNNHEWIEFRNGSFITTYKGDTQNGNILTEKRCQFIEIIGNIYQNPELLNC